MHPLFTNRRLVCQCRQLRTNRVLLGCTARADQVFRSRLVRVWNRFRLLPHREIRLPHPMAARRNLLNGLSTGYAVGQEPGHLGFFTSTGFIILFFDQEPIVLPLFMSPAHANQVP